MSEYILGVCIADALIAAGEDMVRNPHGSAADKSTGSGFVAAGIYLRNFLNDQLPEQARNFTRKEPRR